MRDLIPNLVTVPHPLLPMDAAESDVVRNAQ